ncbi:hypothetical protein, partial [Klebsiella pneumoniae]|uniref:hypothetical protein n=1 Tax=Klebsiella pneumoniae TaxID=573 RepID=UPI00183BAE4F
PSTTHLSPDKFPSPIPQYSPQPYPPSFPYIPESFIQCLFVIHPPRSQILIHQYFYNFTLMKSFLFAVYSRIFLRREGFR